MPTPPFVDPGPISVGGTVSSTRLNTMRDNDEFLARPPGVQAVRTANQSIPTATWTAVQFTAADTRDTDGFHSTTENQHQFIIPAGLGGWYQCAFLAQFAANTSGYRAQRIQINGATVIPGGNYASPTGAGGATRMSLADEILLAPGDVVTFDVYQSSGGALNLDGARVTMRLVALP